MERSRYRQRMEGETYRQGKTVLPLCRRQNNMKIKYICVMEETSNCDVEFIIINW